MKLFSFSEVPRERSAFGGQVFVENLFAVETLLRTLQ